MPPKNRFAEMLPELTAIRRDFHENPELLFDVHRTAAKVAEFCRAIGCDEVVEGIGRSSTGRSLVESHSRSMHCMLQICSIPPTGGGSAVAICHGKLFNANFQITPDLSRPKSSRRMS